MNILAGIAAVAFAIGGLLSGGATYWVQSVKLERAELTIKQLRQSIELANSLAEHQAVQAADRIASLESDLAQSLKQRRVQYVDRIKEVRVVASPTSVCLSPGAVGVLRNAQRDADATSKGARSPVDPSPEPAPGAQRPASEQAIALWMGASIWQYGELQARFNNLAETMRTLPCVKVE